MSPLTLPPPDRFSLRGKPVAAAEHVELLLKNYLGSGQAVLETYLRELSGAREKN